MTRTVKTGFISLVLAAALALSATGQTLPLQEVTLYTSGVAEYVHRGVPDENGVITLPVVANRVADVVRSVTVLDADGQPVTNITLPSGESVQTRLSRFQIDLNNVHTFVDLANEARGSVVTVVSTGGRRVTGTVIGAGTSGAPPGPIVPGRPIVRPGGSETAADAPAMLVAVGGSVGRIPIAEIESLTFTDPTVQREFDAALATLASRDGPEAPRTLEIHFADASDPAGQPVTVRYLQEAPLWKTSYRAVREGARVHLQGWAHITNVDGIDWDKVSLSIVSARPVTYAIDVYTPEYVQRHAPSGDTPPSGISRSYAAASEDRMERSAADAMASSVTVQVNEAPIVAGIAFTFPDPISVPAGTAAMIPIVNRAFDAELIRSFDSRRDETSPRIALSFRNTSSTQLPPGPVTIYDGDRYAGDALLPVLLPRGQATLPYAVDVGHEVVRETETGDEELRRVAIVDGILVEEHRTRRTVQYRIGKPGDAGRPEPITITHEIDSRWALVSPPPERATGTEYTFVTNGTRLTIITERLREQRVALTEADERKLLSYSSNRLIDPTVRRMLRNVLELRRTVSDFRDSRQALEEQIATIRDDQGRISANMQALERDSALYRRYVRELDDQEDRLSLLREELADVRGEEETAESALREYLRTLQD